MTTAGSDVFHSVCLFVGFAGGCGGSGREGGGGGGGRTAGFDTNLTYVSSIPEILYERQCRSSLIQ